MARRVAEDAAQQRAGEVERDLRRQIAEAEERAASAELEVQAAEAEANAIVNEVGLYELNPVVHPQRLMKTPILVCQFNP